MTKDFHPIVKPNTRLKLAYSWLPEKINNLFDAGCSSGYGTYYFKQKTNNAVAMDIDEASINIAKNNYPDIDFLVGPLENTKLNSETFDCITCLDVLEHTEDKIQTLNELDRLLKPGGILILSTPHKGMYTFLDPYNFGFYLRTKAFKTYKFLYSIAYLLKKRRLPKEFTPAHFDQHFHYSLKDLTWMLNESSFNGNFVIEKKFLSGWLIYPLSLVAEAMLLIVLPERITRVIIKPFTLLGELDYWIPFGKMSYNIALKIKKIR